MDTSDSRSSVRRAVPGSLARLRAGGHHLARPRHRRQHRDLQPAERAPAHSDAGRGSRSASPPSTRATSAAHIRFVVLSRLPGFPRAGSAVADIAAYRLTPVSMNRRRDGMAFVEAVSGNYFSMLGVGAARGRLLVEPDDRPDAAAAVVISHALWTRRFANDPNVVGRTLQFNGHPFTIVGLPRANTRARCAASRSMPGSRSLAVAPALPGGGGRLDRAARIARTFAVRPAAARRRRRAGASRVRRRRRATLRRLSAGMAHDSQYRARHLGRRRARCACASGSDRPGRPASWRCCWWSSASCC